MNTLEPHRIKIFFHHFYKIYFSRVSSIIASAAFLVWLMKFIGCLIPSHFGDSNGAPD